MSNPNLKKIIKLTQTQYDILSNGGTVGDYTGLNDNYLYLIQSDSPDLPIVGSGDKNKVLHTNASTGALEWSGNYVDLTSAQTISGVKTFSNGLNTSSIRNASGTAKLYIGTNLTAYCSFLPETTNIYDIGSSSLKWQDAYISNQLKLYNGSNSTAHYWSLGTDATYSELRIGRDGSNYYTFNTNGIMPTGSRTLGSKYYKWLDLFLSGGLRDGNNDNYKLVLPDSTSWTANKTIATTDDIPTVNDATLTITQNSTSIGTFTANASSNVTIDITTPQIMRFI